MELRILIFGDSITWGAGDPEYGGWVTHLRRFFETHGYGNVEVFNLGIPGDTTDDILVRFRTECRARSRHPNLILFAAGINDAKYIRSESNPVTPPEKFRKNVEDLIEKAREFAADILFLGLSRVDESVTMPLPWSPDEFFSNSKSAEYDSIIRQTCTRHGLGFIPLSDLPDRSELADGLHPNTEGYRKMFQRILEFLLDHHYLPKPLNP